jgi:RNA polymerase sigma-70 factor (ECF subfamily)
MAVEEHFTKLIQGNAGIIHKVLLLYVDDVSERGDLYQEIVLQAWKSYDKFRQDSKFSTWLYRVALNTVFTFNRKESKRPEMSDFSEVEHHLESDQSEDKRDKKDQLLWLIKRLDEIDRAIISLHLDGYNNKEIAEITGLKSNHIGVKLHRIKEKLITKMKGDQV